MARASPAVGIVRNGHHPWWASSVARIASDAFQKDEASHCCSDDDGEDDESDHEFPPQAAS